MRAEYFHDLSSKLILLWDVAIACAITCTWVSSLIPQVLGFLLALVFVLVWIMLQVVVATLLDHFVAGGVSIYCLESSGLGALYIFLVSWLRMSSVHKFDIKAFAPFSAATAKAFQGESMEKLDNAVDMNIDTGGLEPLLGEVIKLFDTSDQISRGFKKIFHVSAALTLRIPILCRMYSCRSLGVICVELGINWNQVADHETNWCNVIEVESSYVCSALLQKFDYDRTGRIDFVKMKEGDVISSSILNHSSRLVPHFFFGCQMHLASNAFGIQGPTLFAPTFVWC